MNNKILSLIIIIAAIIIVFVVTLLIVNKNKTNSNSVSYKVGDNKTNMDINNQEENELSKEIDNQNENLFEEKNNTENNLNGDSKMEKENSNFSNPEKNEYKIKVTVNDQELYATLKNNATTMDFIKKLPITLPMMDLYNREMCYRFDDALTTDNLQSNSYEVGEIAYWPPRHSFVILYEQNGEKFERQVLGKFDSSVDIFKTTGNTNVKFELIE